ncbi:heat-inducible transcription repressor HrcA [Aminithiophilus ramosus]|uniref:Heat-inducible transcription repressor HrcA n=2 Tax=Synergistales TaxID=649776 RepID=A0A9Q7ASJ3_9BACT|nr:heat-inducible transcriptional repressor HrcA [Aminithiophilus ramosus]QTX33171.1 heat-inducible transcription repressor HrcA [Aminithiophilus ramosus]QVL37068.1 heat-inducible transcription repressor HrcA [Synergistota bacterium]
MLTERQLEVVLSVVYDYITTGEPVGSRTISRRYLTGKSAATIRNEMSELSEMGYLNQPHTSAGRIPTAKAYRLYVDAILQRRREPSSTLAPFLRDLRAKRQDVEAALAMISHLLSRLTRSVGLAGVELLEEVLVHRIDFLPVDSRHALVLTVLQGGLVHHRMIEFAFEVKPSELDELSLRLNLLASGKAWSEVRQNLSAYLAGTLDHLSQSCFSALEAIDAMLTSRSMKVFTGGAHHILGLPDFQDIGKLQALMALLEEESSLERLVRSVSLEEGLSVLIGEENPLEEMQSCSLVLSSGQFEGKRMVVGLIGPQRMDYEGAIVLLEGLLPHLTGTRDDDR